MHPQGPGSTASRIEAFRPSPALSIQEAGAATEMAQAVLEANQGLDGLRLFDRLIAKAPIKPVFARFFVAVLNLQLRDLRKAGFARDEADGKVTVTFPTQDGAAWLAMGRHLTRLGDYSRGLDALQRAAALRPNCHATACFLGQLLVLHGRYDEADEVFARAEKACAMFVGTTRFSDAFWRDVALLGGEQPAGVDWVAASAIRPRAVLLLSSDSGYFHRYAGALVSSWRRARALGTTAAGNASWLIHFHLVHPDGAALEQVRRWRAEGLAVAATLETPVLPAGEMLDAPRFCHVPTYYACARLRVAPWLLQHYRVPLAISDMDMTLVGDPDRILRDMEDADVGLLRLPAHQKPLWEEYWLSLLVLRPTREGVRFGVLHASYTEHFLRLGKLVWTLDQAGQYSTAAFVARHHREAIVKELPLELIVAPGWDAAKPDARPVFANSAASMSYQTIEQVSSALQSMPRQEMLALTGLAHKRLEHLREHWSRQFGSRVVAGPFAGMVYHERSIEGSYLPKVLGTYEQEVQPVLRGLASRAYRRVVNIGCGDGYYAVGLARLLKLPVLAIDTDQRARAACETLAAINGVGEWVRVSAQRVLAADLGGLAPPDTLLVIDIEGGERELLQPEALAALAACDLLIEVHDCNIPDLSLALCDRLEPSHRTQLLERRDVHADLPEAWKALSDLDRLLSLWEFRDGPTPWLWACGRKRAVAEGGLAG